MGSTLSMFTSRKNKEFQSVLPFPSDAADQQSLKKRKTSPQKSSKTAPSPIDEKVEPAKLREEPGSHSTRVPVSKDPSSASLVSVPTTVEIPAPLTNETAKLTSSVDSSYMQTESQQRRERMADCEFECSRITSYLFVAGYHIATNREILRRNGITHIINCSAAVVENAFIDDKSLKYLSLSMVDGRQDDISWFLCEVIQFIMKARSTGGKILIHCEKGISRSCSFAIAYRMWATGEKWKTSFDFVKRGRSICSPNTAFTCNLIELGELLGKDAATTGAGGNLLFRCAYHLPHDPKTAVLKLLRTTESRKIMAPSTSLLDPKGVFILRTVYSNNPSLQHNVEDHRIFLWQGAETTDVCANRAEELAKKMHGVLTTTDHVEWIKQGEETYDFLSYMVEDGVFSAADNSLFDDFYDYPPPADVTLQSQKQMEADHTKNIVARPTTVRETSIKGFAEFPEGPLSRESSMKSMHLPLLSRTGSANGGMVDMASRRSSGAGLPLEPLLTRRDSGSNLPPISMQLDLQALPAIGRGSASRDRSDSKGVDNYSPPSSATGSRQGSDYTTLPNSRIPSIQLPEQTNFMDQHHISPLTISAVQAMNHSSEQARRINVPELSLVSKTPSLLQMQRVSEGGEFNYSDMSSSRMNSSRQHTGRDADVRLAVPLMSDRSGASDGGSGALRSPALVSSPDALNRDYISPSGSIEGSLQLSATQTPAGSKGPVPALATTSLKTDDQKVSPDSRSQPLASTSARSPTQAAHSSPRVLALAVPTIGSPGAAEGVPMYRQTSTEKLRRGVPPLGDSRPTSATGTSPLTDRRIAGSTASVLATLGGHVGGVLSNNNSATNLHAGLALPLRALERSPSTERHPHDVGLSRGATPIEDLSSPRGVRAALYPVTPDAHSNSTYPSPQSALPGQVESHYCLMPSASRQSGIAELPKPLLYQAVLKDVTRPNKRSSSGAPVNNYEWQAMGVYDDDDLDEVCMCLYIFAFSRDVGEQSSRCVC